MRDHLPSLAGRNGDLSPIAAAFAQLRAEEARQDDAAREWAARHPLPAFVLAAPRGTLVDELVACALRHGKLLQDPDGRPLLVEPQPRHRAHVVVRLDSPAAYPWLRGTYYRATRAPVGRSTVYAALRCLREQATEAPRSRRRWRRLSGR
jgi:hypothetical protein